MPRGFFDSGFTDPQGDPSSMNAGGGFSSSPQFATGAPVQAQAQTNPTQPKKPPAEVQTIEVPAEDGGLGKSLGTAADNSSLRVWAIPEGPAGGQGGVVVPKFADFPKVGGIGNFVSGFGPQYGEAQAGDMSRIGASEKGEGLALEGVHSSLENQLRAQQFELAKYQQEHEQRVTEAVNQAKDYSDRIANYRVSTDKFWKNPASIIAGIGSIFSGIFSGDPNGATKMLTSYINADIDNQKAELESYKGARDASLNTLGMYRQLWGDKQAADSFARSKAFDIAAQQVEGLKQRFRSQTAIDRADMVAQHLRQQAYMNYANAYAMIYSRESVAPSKEMAAARLSGAMSYGTAEAIGALQGRGQAGLGPQGGSSQAPGSGPTSRPVQAAGPGPQVPPGEFHGTYSDKDPRDALLEKTYVGALELSKKINRYDPGVSSALKDAAVNRVREVMQQAEAAGPRGSHAYKKAMASHINELNNADAKQLEGWIQAGKGRDDLQRYVMWSQMANNARQIMEATKHDPILSDAFSNIHKGTGIGMIMDRVKQRFSDATPQGKAAIEYYAQLARILVEDRKEYLGASQTIPEQAGYKLAADETDTLPIMLIKLQQGAKAANTKFLAGAANLGAIPKAALYNEVISQVETSRPSRMPGIKRFDPEAVKSEKEETAKKAIEALKGASSNNIGKLPSSISGIPYSESPWLKVK